MAGADSRSALIRPLARQAVGNDESGSAGCEDLQPFPATTERAIGVGYRLHGDEALGSRRGVDDQVLQPWTCLDRQA